MDTFSPKTGNIYVSTAFPSGDSEKNALIVDGFSKIISNLDKSEYKKVKAEFFGSPAISLSNIRQIKADTVFTTLAALVVIFLGLFWYFRSFKTILLLFFPVVFGAGFSLALVYLISDEISAIAIGAGSIVLGIAMDYSLHFFTHLKHERSAQKVISDLTLPLTLGCTTTVGAFLCLNFMQSEALHDMGLFAAFSLLGAAFCCLVILPQLVKSFEKKEVNFNEHKVLDKITTYPFHKSKILLVLVLFLTILFSFFYNRVGFETDMTKLSYISPELAEAENNLDKVTNYKLKSVFLVSTATTLEEALNINAKAVPVVKDLEKQQLIKKHSNVGEFLVSDSIRRLKIIQWKKFWTEDKVNLLRQKLYLYGDQFHFKKQAFDNTLVLLSKNFNYKSDSSFNELKKLFLKEYISETKKTVSVITILKVNQSDKTSVYKAFESVEEIFVLDRGSMATMFAAMLSEDFNLILVLCSVMVFGFLFLSYGRIELALLAFLPMLISWIWILGIMGLFGLKFNIVNIVICTFIFGLGDDYSIFTIDGLEQQFKFNKNISSSYRNSIFLSAFTTIVGIGVLIFAKHPALKSIALVTVIGISCIVFVSLVVQPFIYDLFVLRRKKQGKLPVTVFNIFFDLIFIKYFVLGCLYLKLVKAVSSEEKAQVLSMKFLRSLTSYVLFTEQSLGDDWPARIARKYIDRIPLASLSAFENSYSEKRILIPSTDYYRGRLMKGYIFKGPLVEWYSRIKTRLENNYKIFDDLVPKKGKIVDIGCGYGYLGYMLNMTSPERRVTGIDYDEEKIEIAENSVLRNSAINFVHSDVLDFAYEKTDVFIINDVLHYLREEGQKELIHKCLDNLNESGMLIIRDGNSDMEKRHRGTRLTEFFSTKLLSFNKVTIDRLCFTSKEKIISIVSGYPFTVEVLDNTQYTSNIIFIIRKK